MYLEKILCASDVKKLNIKELKVLAEEIRAEIVKTVSNNGGHLSPNLGLVEFTIAMLYVFDVESDKVIFDVGHQSYAYKILTGRYSNFSSIRQENGISGFPDISESKYDAFSVGHAGTSISAGLGYAYARDNLNEDYHVVQVVGDASFFNGENLEALTLNDSKPNKFLLVLNDNGMSISKNNNGLYKAISKITVNRSYTAFNDFLAKTIGKCFIGKFLRSIKSFTKRVLSSNTIFDGFGLKYVGMFDGHNIKQLVKILENVKQNKKPTLLHIKTNKGKGFKEAEENPSQFHGVSKDFLPSTNDFSDSVSKIMEKIALKNDKVVAITAGMKDGVGLADFASKFSGKVIDVGIAESSAVTMAGGMALGGLKPIVFIYSTFLQRAYDQILHDICLQNLPVVFCLDRAGFVGSDGKTHQGLFDLSYLSSIPNLKIFAPKSVNEFDNMLNIALELNSPVAIRYPNGKVDEISDLSPISNSLKWEILNEGEKVSVLAVGPRCITLANKLLSNGENFTLINARIIKPLDEQILLKIRNDKIIVLEENMVLGGFGNSVLNFYSLKSINANVKIVGVEDKFVSHASTSNQLVSNNLSAENLLKLIKE